MSERCKEYTTERSVCWTKRRRKANPVSFNSIKELKCAAGVLIPEEFYSKDLEGRSWYRLVKESNFPSEHFDLICELQSLHDYLSPECWEEQLIKIADTFKLKYY